MRTHLLVGAILVVASGLSACADKEQMGSASSPSEEAAYNAGAARREYDRSVAEYRRALKIGRPRVRRTVCRHDQCQREVLGT
jgi:hypothetical protein